jgi:hypothetical protein
MRRLAALLTAVAAASAQSIEWAPDLENAMDRSRRDNRPVLAYFTFDT